MQKCMKCEEKFSYKQVLKSGFLGYRPIQCTHCNERYKATISYRFRVAFGIMLIPLLSFFDLLGQSKMTILLIFVVVNAIVIATLPYLIRFNREDMKEEH